MTDKTGFSLKLKSDASQRLAVVLINVFIFALAYAILRAPAFVSLAFILLVIVGLLAADKYRIIAWVYDLFIRHKKLAFTVAFLCAMAMPLLFAPKSSQYIAHIAVMACIYSMVCLGLNFQMGSADMVNFAPAAFMGIGAYSMAVVTVNMGLSGWIGILAAIFFSCTAGLLIGLPTLRTKGYYLSLVTMALQLVFTQLIKNIPYFGGPNGITGVKSLSIGDFAFYKSYTLFGIKLAPHVPLFFFCLLILIFFIYIAMRVGVSHYGLSLNTIAQDEVAANCLGINCNRRKLFAFIIGSIFCGIGGALNAGLTSFVGPSDYTFARSLIFICMVILGGMDNPIGVVVGAFLLTVLTEKLREFADYAQLIYALVLVTVLIVRPAGLIPKRVRNYCALFNRKLRQLAEPAAPSVSEQTFQSEN
ncbi:MAG: branched-chain amino acid ABC transporter permease [Firmicutes bacterium]|nr:branched-chain amino acid ABC transporter permease [Bacillota bacterium]